MKPPSDRTLAATLLVAIALVWAGHAWTALAYPLGNDPGIFQYLAWAMTVGDVPYVDSFEFNTPGIIVWHWAYGSVAGFSDEALIGLALALSALAVAGATWSLRKRCSLAALALGAGVATWTFVGITPWDRGQRELFQGVLLLAAFGAARRAARTPGRTAASAWATLVGLLCGVATTIKITFGAVLWPLYVLWLIDLFAARRAEGTAGMRTGVVASLMALLGWTLPLAGVLAWLHAIDAWEAFWFAQRTYLPLHGSLLTVPTMEALQKPLAATLLVLGIASAVISVLACRRGSPTGDLRGPLRVLAWIHLGTVALYLGQRHGWTYHLQIALPFVAPTVALGWTALTERAPFPRGLPGSRWSPIACAVALVPICVAALIVRYDAGPGLSRAKQVGEHWDHEAQLEVAALLQRAGPPTDRVLTNNDEQQLLYMARRLSATPFVYGFLFSESHPKEQLAQLALARVRALQDRPAQWVVWNEAPYKPELDSLAANPVLQMWIIAHCQRVTQHGPYSVWRCRDR